MNVFLRVVMLSMFCSATLADFVESIGEIKIGMTDVDVKNMIKCEFKLR